MGRTGKMFAYQGYGVTPDIVTTAKALGCGVPVGAFLAKEKAAKAMVPGDHGSTYGGNPLATAAINAVFEQFDKLKVLDNVNEVSEYMSKKLDDITDEFDCIEAHRGKGLMQGLVVKVPVGEIINKCLENGLIVISAGKDVLRFVPPLVITKENVDEMIKILKNVLAEF